MLESLVFSRVPLDRLCLDTHQRTGGNTWRSAAALAALALLTACTTTPEPQIVVKEVKIPVMVPCAIDTTEPTYVADQDSLLEAAKRGADAAVALLLGERAQRIAWGEGIKRQAGACSG